MTLVVLAIALSGIASAPHRSQGYAGSTPVGFDGQVALNTLDCAAINADPVRGRVRTPLADDCPLAIPSPDGRLLVRTVPAPDGSMMLIAPAGLVVRGLSQPTVLLWKPDASGFLLNEGEGSGQVSHLRYYYRTGGGWRSTGRLDAAASASYKRRFDCRGGRKSYVNTSGWNWTPAGELRVIVQEGVHSEGCLQPHDDHNVLFEVIGDPVTGRISSAREIDALP